MLEQMNNSPAPGFSYGLWEEVFCGTWEEVSRELEARYG